MIIQICVGLVIVIISLYVGYKISKKKYEAEIYRVRRMSDKHLAIMNLFSMWLQNKEHGLKIEDYLKTKGIRRIAIYGMSFVGERLYDELEGSDIEIVYCIDRNANNIYKAVEVVNPECSLEENIDAIIVTAFMFFDEIEPKLKEKVNVPILSIDDIVYSL